MISQTTRIGLDAEEALIDWAELEHIELVVLKRMKEYAVGAHSSVFHGEGFDFMGLRDWQPGDRPTDIDWAQSTLTNFSPMVTREFEQQSTASMMIVADTSRSTRCGVNGVPIAKVVASSVAALSLAGAFFQDQVGLITIDGSTRLMSVRQRVGKNHAIHCVEAYQAAVLSDRNPSGVEGDQHPLRNAQEAIAGARRVGLLVRGHDRSPRRALPARGGPRRVPRPGRQRLRVRAAVGVGRMGGDLRRGKRRDTHPLRRRPSRDGRRRPRLAAHHRARGPEPGSRGRAGRTRTRARGVVGLSGSKTVAKAMRQMTWTVALWLGLGAATSTQPAEPGTEQVQVDALQCWRDVRSQAVSVGEPFTMTITCGVVETDAATTVLNEVSLAPETIDLSPFEVIEGRRFEDVRDGPWRFSQYHYTLRVIDEEVFGQDVEIPELELLYHIERSLDGGSALPGRELRYILPAVSVRVLSLVPDSADDIRGLQGETFGDADARLFRSNLSLLVAGALGVLALGCLIAAAVHSRRHRRGAAPQTDRPVSDGAVMRRALSELTALQRTSQAEGWNEQAAGPRARGVPAGQRGGPVDTRRPTTSRLAISAARRSADGDPGVRASPGRRRCPPRSPPMASPRRSNDGAPMEERATSLACRSCTTHSSCSRVPDTVRTEALGATS